MIDESIKSIGFGDMLRDSRIDQSLTIDNLSKITGLSENKLRDLERNKEGEEPTNEEVRSLEKALNLTNNQLKIMVKYIKPFFNAYNDLLTLDIDKGYGLED